MTIRHSSAGLRALLVALAVVLVACGTGGAGPRAAASRAIDVWIMEPGSPPLKSFFERATTEFEAGHRGVDVRLQFVPWANAHDQFVTAIGGGQVPDLAEMGSTWTPEFGAAGALAPVDESLGSRYVPALVGSATVDRRVYGLPWYAGARALIYRADVLAQLGLRPPATWADLVSVGRAVKARTHLFPFGVAGNGNHYFLPMVWQNGGEIAVEQGGRWVSRLDAPQAVEAIRFYADLYAAEKFSPPGALSWNSRDVRAAFQAGDLAMMIGGGWDLQAILAGSPELKGKVGTALLPEGPGHSRDTFAGGSHLVVFEGSRQKALARSYARFLLAPQRVSAFTDQIGFLPATVDGLDASVASTDGLLAPFRDQLQRHSRTYPPAKEWGRFEGDGLFTAAVQQVMQGKRSAADAMGEVADTMNRAFRER